YFLSPLISLFPSKEFPTKDCVKPYHLTTQAIKIQKMPRGARLTDIRRQARLSSPYQLTAGQQ
ncbi:hypothetical protein MKX03_005958, partial [Papaver bracteatum]